MNSIQFSPFFGKTQNVSANSTSASITLDAIGAACSALLFSNTGTKTAFVRYGVSTQTAVATTDMPIIANSQQVFSKPIGADTVAIVCLGADTTTVYVTPGEGQ